MPELDAAGGRYSGVSTKRGGRRLARQTVDFSDVADRKAVGDAAMSGGLM